MKKDYTYLEKCLPHLKQLGAPLSMRNINDPIYCSMLIEALRFFEEDKKHSTDYYYYSYCFELASLCDDIASCPRSSISVTEQEKYLSISLLYFAKSIEAIPQFKSLYSEGIILAEALAMQKKKHYILLRWGVAYGHMEMVGIEQGWDKEKLKLIRAEKIEKYMSALDILTDEQIAWDLIETVEIEQTRLYEQVQDLLKSDIAGMIALYEEINEMNQKVFNILHKKSFSNMTEKMEAFTYSQSSYQIKLLDHYILDKSNPLTMQKFDALILQFKKTISTLPEPIMHVQFGFFFILKGQSLPDTAYLEQELFFVKAAAAFVVALSELKPESQLYAIVAKQSEFINKRACSPILLQDLFGGPAFRYKAILDKAGNFGMWYKCIFLITPTALEYHSHRLWNSVGPEKSLKGSISLLEIIEITDIIHNDRAGHVCIRITVQRFFKSIYKISTTQENLADLTNFKISLEQCIQWYKDLIKMGFLSN